MARKQTDRPRMLSLRVSDQEHAMLDAIARDTGGTFASVIRTWIRTQYETRFGRTPVKAAR